MVDYVIQICCLLGFVGFAPTLYEIVTSSEVNNADDDQLFYTKVFLDKRVSYLRYYSTT